MHMQVTVTFNWLQHTTYTSRSCIFSQKPLQVLRILLEGWQRRRTSVALWFLQTGIVLQDLQHYMWKLRTNKHLYEMFYAYAGDSDIHDTAYHIFSACIYLTTLCMYPPKNIASFAKINPVA